jgi:uncharacterized membrane protein YiaA
MTVDAQFFLDQTAILPLVVLLWLVKYSPNRVFYKPFITLLILKEVAEIIAVLLVKKFHLSTNAVPYNLFYFAEAILFTIQYWQWKTFNNKKNLFVGILVFLIGLWIVDTFILNSLTTFNLYFRLAYCSLLTLIAIYQINLITVTYKQPMFKNTIAIVSIALIVLFTFNLVYEVSFRIGYLEKKFVNLSNIVDKLMSYVNALANILFAWAVYNFPTIKDFTIPAAKK